MELLSLKTDKLINLYYTVNYIIIFLLVIQKKTIIPYIVLQGHLLLFDLFMMSSYLQLNLSYFTFLVYLELLFPIKKRLKYSVIFRSVCYFSVSLSLINSSFILILILKNAKSCNKLKLLRTSKKLKVWGIVTNFRNSCTLENVLL